MDLICQDDIRCPIVGADFPEKKKFSLCVGCGQQILDQYILKVAPDLEWHAACLKCQECKQFLDESCTCFVRDGKIYCKIDYVRLFGRKCEKCGMTLNENDFVMKAKSKVFHLQCFRCCACEKHLIPGDEFALRDEQFLYCKIDNDALEKGAPADIKTIAIDIKQTINTSNSDSSELESKSDAKKESGSSKNFRNMRRNPVGSKDFRSVTRTVLNKKQRNILSTFFNSNPRPGFLMRKKIAEVVGLPPKVILKWFQNSRANHINNQEMP